MSSGVGITFGLLPTGFVALRLADVLLAYQTALKNVFGSNVDLSNDGPFGQLAGILAERETLLWELLEQVYQAGIVSGASGQSLQNVLDLLNLKRLTARATVVPVTVTGTPGTVIPSNSQLATNNTGTLYASTADFVIPGTGSGTLNFTCTITGPLPCLANTLSVIRTPVTGWTLASNPLDATADQIGRNAETDAEFLVRRQGAVASAASSSMAGVVTKVLNVANVTEVKVVQNLLSYADADGRPPRSCEVVVRGGADADIRVALYANAPLGTPLVGNVPGTVLDIRGDAQSVPFSRATLVPIYITVFLTVDQTFPLDGISQVQSAILAYGDLLKLSQTVGPYGISKADGMPPGIVEMDIRIGLTSGPTDDAPIVMGAVQLAAFDSTRLTVQRVN